MSVNTKIQLGTAVTYVSSKGYQKLAFVIATPETVKPGHDLLELSEGFLHLMVFAPSGIYPRFSVPSEEVAKEIPDFAVDGDEIKGIWKPVA